MILTNENCSRKMDSLGRISIPKSMRDRLQIADGEELEFYMLEDDKGDKYVCMSNHRELFNKYKACAEVLHELGIRIPDSLKDRIEEVRKK